MARDEIKIKRQVLERYGISVGQFLGLLIFYFGASIYTVIEDLRKENLITPQYKGSKIEDYTITPEGINLAQGAIIDAERNDQKEPKSNKDDLSKLVEDLRNIFPEGKKEETNQYWKGGSTEIKTRIESFFKKYGWYPYEDIITAAQKYVDSFAQNGNYKNMRLLKYFIWKRENKYGEIEETSDLHSFLENQDSEETINDDWTTQLK